MNCDTRYALNAAKKVGAEVTSVMEILRIALSYEIEGHWCICILGLFVIGFNPSNVYPLL